MTRQELSVVELTLLGSCRYDFIIFYMFFCFRNSFGYTASKPAAGRLLNVEFVL